MKSEYSQIMMELSEIKFRLAQIEASITPSKEMRLHHDFPNGTLAMNSEGKPIVYLEGKWFNLVEVEQEKTGEVV